MINNNQPTRFKQPFLPVLEKIKSLYTSWIVIHRKIPRAERFGIGNRIDNAFLDLLTALRRATFTEPHKKLSLLEIAVIKIDDIRFFIHILWDNHLISDSQFALFGDKVEIIGRDVGAWRKDIIKKTSTCSNTVEER